MAQSYTRQSSFSDGDTITAALFNNEYNQLVNAFTYSSSSASSTGHRHDGTTGHGGNIHTIGDLDFLNKIMVSSNTWEFYVEVSSAAAKQMILQDGALVPNADSDLDLGTSSVYFKNAYIDSITTTGAITSSSTVQGTTITATTAFVPDASDGAALGTSSLEFSDLFLADGAVINFGDDQDVSLTHVADTGLLLSSTDQLQFGDSGTYIYQSADGVLDLVSDTEIEINATTIDINGAADVSGNLAVGGNLTVTGNATISGNLTFGDAASDTVAFSADVASNLLPSADNTYDIGASGSEWKDLYIDGTANIDSLVADTADINGGTVDGAIIGGSSAAAITGTAITGTSFVIGSADISEAELETIDGVTAGTVAASKAVVVDSNKDAASFRNITLTGELDAGSLDVSGDADIDGTLETDALSINGTAVTSTAAELNILDGVTSTAAELNILDGVTASATDINLIDGITNGTVIASKAIITDANKDISGGRNITISGELDAATLDISGDADIDGTLEADAITIGGTTLAETISDTVGAMVGSNTETGITVTYEDGDNTLDFAIGTLNQDTTGTADNITVSANNSADETVYPIFVDGATGSQGAESDTGLTYNPSSGVLTSTSFTGNLTGNVTGNTSGTAATVTGAAQSNITSLGTLTTLTVDNIIVNGTTIGHTSDTDLITLADGNVTIAGELDLTTLDVSGDADIDGTLEADAITIGGTTLAEFISDTAGAMFSSNTETGITATYQDADNTIDLVVGTLNQDTTGTASKVTVSDSTANTNFPVVFHDESNALLDDTGALRYNPSTGELLVPKLTVAGTTTTADTVTMQASNAIVFEGATADSNETTLSIVDPTSDHTQYLVNQGGYIPVLAAATTTQISSTPAELNLLDGSSANTVVNSKAVIYGSSGELAGTLSTAAQTNITSLGTLSTLTVDDITINGSTISDGGDLTIDAEGDITLDANGGDIKFQDGGTDIGTLYNSSSDFVIKSMVNDKDIIFNGIDNSSDITALTLDMSAAGAATFNSFVDATNYKIGGAQGSDGQVLTSTGSGVAWENASGGAVTAINNATANELVTIGSTTTELDAEANLTFDGTTLSSTSGTAGAWIASLNNSASGGAGVLITSAGATGSENLLDVRNGDGTKFVVKQSDGDVGIGTSSPDTMLHLYKATGSGALEPEIKIENNHNTSSTTDGAGRLTFYSDDSNNSGIPDLSWLGQVRFMGDDKDGSATEFEYAYMVGLARDPGSGTDRKGGLSFYTRDGNSMTETATITEDSLGIGTASPSHKVEVSDGAVASKYDATDHVAIRGLASGQYIQYGSGRNLSFVAVDTYPNSGATTQMTLTTAGKLYIGATGPDVAGTLSVQAGNAGVPVGWFKNTNADSVGIRSQVNSNAASNYIYYAVNSGGGVWQIRNDGDHQGTDTSIGSLSDSRLKKDVSDLTYDIDKFKQYRPIEFNWINPELHKAASGKSRGFLAQEVKALDDYYVDQYDAEGADLSLVDADKKAYSTKFGYKDAMYISVIKQLITRLEAAEEKIAALEGGS